MGGKQECVVFDSYDDPYFEEFLSLLNDKANLIFEEYDELGYHCDAVLLEFYPLEDRKKKNMLKKIPNIKKAKEKLSKSDFNEVKKVNLFGNDLIEQKGVPLTVDLKDGKLKISGLEGNTDMVGFGERFLEKQTKLGGRDYCLTERSKLYLIEHQDKYYINIIDVLYQRNNKVNSEVSTSKFSDENCREKIQTIRSFNKFGSKIYEVKDTLYKNGTTKKEKGNLNITFDSNNEILLSEKKIKFDSIKNDFKEKEDKGLANSKIGVLDLETYEQDSVAYCYAIGFFSSEDENCKTFYIDKDLNSFLLVHNCINEMLRPKYKGINFYVHNLGRFDAAFIIKALTLFNMTEEGVKNPYIFDTITRDSNILKLVIKRKIDNKVRMVKILDSVAILPRSLRDLCKDYDVEISKSYFPYLFCTKDTLFYKGKTPDISYYKDISLEDYNSLCREV